jgi:excinuclease ABC subunit C
LIDGGKGQVSVAQETLVELGLNEANVLGVAKGEERKPGLEQLIFPGMKKPLQLPKDHPGLHLIQQIRDEAHRFAIQGHRARRGKSRTSSSLEQVSGIGTKRRQNLLARFGGLKGVLTASIEELQQTEGISRGLAEKIYKELH